MIEKRTFSKEEKLQFLNEVEQNGVKTILEKHGIYLATYYSWKKKYKEMVEAGFRQGITPAHIKVIEKNNCFLLNEKASFRKNAEELAKYLKTC